MMTICVKGNKEQAIAAAKQRGIEEPCCTVANEIVSLHSSPLTILSVEEILQKRVWDWFGEYNEITKGKGYPIGTLLYYNYQRDSEKAQYKG